MRIGAAVYLEKWLNFDQALIDRLDGIEIQDFIMPSALDQDFERILAKYEASLSEFKGQLSLHGPYIDLAPHSFDPIIRSVTRKRYERCLEAARRLGADKVIIHSPHDKGQLSPSYRQLLVEQSVTFWNSFLPTLEEFGVKVLLENIHHQDPGVLTEIIEELGSSRFGLCLDIGHAHALSARGVVEWVAGYGERLEYLHVHDNDGSEDNHGALQSGSIDFETLILNLNTSGTDPMLMLELFGDQSEFIDAFDYLESMIG